MADELNETTKLAMKLHEEKSPHQLAVELAELQRKYQIALGAIDRLQDQRDEAISSFHNIKKEWTDAQCVEFLSVAFRHCDIKGDVVLDEIRQGVAFALAMGRN